MIVIPYGRESDQLMSQTRQMSNGLYLVDIVWAPYTMAGHTR